MKLFGYTTSYNVERLIPYVMPYVERMGYDKFIVYDNESTDNTVELLKRYPFVEIRTFEMKGLDEMKKASLQLEAFTECKKIALNEDDIWMTWTDFDEVLFISSNLSFKKDLDFAYHWYGGYNYFAGHMVELFFPEGKQHFPKDNELIHMNPDIRCRWWMRDGCKPIVLHVNSVQDILIHAGNHIMGIRPKEGIEMLNINQTGMYHAFHLKYIDLENALNTNKNYYTEGYNSYEALFNMKNVKENLSASFPIDMYFCAKLFESTWERNNIHFLEGVYYL